MAAMKGSLYFPRVLMSWQSTKSRSSERFVGSDLDEERREGLAEVQV
jgi:hypothetical protein